MSILSDKEIIDEVEKSGMISPFVDHSVNGSKIISYGLSSFGYDARLASEFKIFHPKIKYGIDFTTALDPKNFDSEVCEDHLGDTCIIPANGFVLGRTLESFHMPEDVIAICIGKSTYARCGVVVNVTPVEPGSNGHVVLEFSNTTPVPVKLYANEGACQFIFFKGKEIPIVNYASKGGQYMHQRGVVLPKVR